MEAYRLQSPIFWHAIISNVKAPHFLAKIHALIHGELTKVYIYIKLNKRADILKGREYEKSSQFY